tara:strand:+ start:1976 stop:2263 length:288 start_codon:yes stop_codon:yes gene_type:complete
MRDLLEGVDNMDTFYECHCEGILGKSTYNIYPSEKEKAFIYVNGSVTLKHIICYQWFYRYDDEKNEAIFYYKGGIPFYVKISKIDLNKYISNNLI